MDTYHPYSRCFERNKLRVLVAGLPLLFAMSCAAQEAPQNNTSALWGKGGELWNAAGRLTDWSFAGYRSGEAAIPNPPVKANVRDFGAKGDDEIDDTQAFVRALEATENGAVLVPAGRYIISDILYIRKSNIVLRGEGPDKTVLFFPKALEHLKPKASATTSGQPTSGYSWSGGLVWVEGRQSGAELGQVQTKAIRGSHVIELAAPAKVVVGQRVEIIQEDTGDKSLINHLYNGQADNVSKIKTSRTNFVSRVVGVDGAKLTLQRALRTDVNPDWKARVRLYQPSVSEVGIENLGFEFPPGPYRGHFTEEGYNPLAFSGVADCWARDIRVLNADSGPFLSAMFVTLQNFVFESKRAADKGGSTGHHGVTLGNDNLLRGFDFRTRFVHDISVEGSGGSVATQGRGVDLCFDNHKRHPHANLFTDIDIGAGTRMYRSGGGADLGRHAGAWTTFWNIRSQRPQSWPATNFGPDLMNFVGVETKDAPVLNQTGRWFEPVAPAQLQPQNLYQAQLDRRLKATGANVPDGTKVLSGAITPLSWAPPTLANPITIQISKDNRSPRLDVSKDYIIKMPATPLVAVGGLVLSGGRNVVLIGGAIEAPSLKDAPESLQRRAVYLKGQSGTVHIEGLHIGGADLAEAFNLDQRLGAVVQLQNIRIEKVQGTRAGHHADLVQTWAGPSELRIDGLTGSTDYQGFFLLPNQHFNGAAPKLFDFRRINLNGSEHSAYMLWTQIKPEFPVKLRDVYVAPNPAKAAQRDGFLWPKPSGGDRSWEGVLVGLPPDGDFVPAGSTGIDYVSPGYQKP